MLIHDVTRPSCRFKGNLFQIYKIDYQNFIIGSLVRPGELT